MEHIQLESRDGESVDFTAVETRSVIGDVSFTAYAPIDLLLKIQRVLKGLDCEGQPVPNPHKDEPYTIRLKMSGTQFERFAYQQYEFSSQYGYITVRGMGTK